MLLTSTTVNGAVSNDSNNNITMSVGNTVIANVNSSGIFFESGKKAIYTGAVLQVIQVVMDDNYIYSVNGAFDLPGLSATITPVSNTSKVLISCVLHYGQGADSDTEDFSIRLRVKRNGIALSYTQDSNRASGDYAVYKTGFNKLQMEVAHFQRLDSPNTSSALTYQIQLSTGTWNTNTVGINRPFRFDDNDYVVSRARSTITLMEIAG